MELRVLEYFLAVAREQNITAAGTIAYMPIITKKRNSNEIS